MEKRKVKIKTWKQLKEEYPLDRDGDIRINNYCYFTKGMEQRLPKDRILELTFDDTRSACWKFDSTIYTITEEMIEKNTKNTKKEVSFKYFFVSYLFSSSEGSGYGRTFYRTSDKYFNINNFDKEIMKNDSTFNSVTVINYKEVCKEEFEYNMSDKD